MGLFGNATEKQLKLLREIATKIDALDNEFSALSDQSLREKTSQFKQRLNDGQTLDDILVEAFAAVRETGRRVLNNKHYFVQLMGGIALHQGRICQMATGEGKTLTATLAAYLNALNGKGVHIVTVNEYLAKRDAEWMGKIYKFLGLTVGVIHTNMSVSEKKKAYESDITYGTNNEFGFDYLRDNMATRAEQIVQRPLVFAIIDEVDSILIDEARTPLILSGGAGRSSEMYLTVNKFTRTLSADDYENDEKDKAIRLTEDGVAKAERFFKIGNLGDIENSQLVHHINQALRAHFVMKLDSDYIVEKGEIVIVDEFTGRKMEGRRYNNGLHQAIEAKENLRVREENKTFATITFQNYFRLYKKMSGMTGTAKTEEGEFNSIYNIDVVEVPTNLPLIRIDYDDVLYATLDAKLRAIVADIAERHKSGQPILVGTITVEKSEQLSHLLKMQGIKHNVLNAKNHEREAEIVAQAGRLGAVTIATNMAGRGTDILLGGNPDFLAKQALVADGLTHEQIELAVSYGESEEVRALKEQYKKHYDKFEKQTNAEKAQVIATGGLHILGTERHESRRIDNQLRGRAGRQGDPGSSVFFISMEDDLARLFGGETMQRAFSFMRVDEDMPITAKILSRSIENAQKRIEGKHFQSRKYVLQYDDVFNLQRNIIYAQRQKVLRGEDIHSDVQAMTETYAKQALRMAVKNEPNMRLWDVEEINRILNEQWLMEEVNLISEDMIVSKKLQPVIDTIKAHVDKMLERRMQKAEEDGMDLKGLERFALLKLIDEKWMNHIEEMDELKQNVGLRGYGNHDPVAVYKREGFDMFEEMRRDVQVTLLKFLLFAHIEKVKVPSAEVKKEKHEVNAELSRNKPCPCGSGKKYKHCCGAKE